MVLTKLGQVYTWGSNEGGQLGVNKKPNDTDEFYCRPQLVKTLSENKQFVI